MLIDSHCHLDFDEFADDRDAVMARAAAAGVDAFVTISIRVKQFGRVLAMAERYPNVYCSVGTLPHFADEERDVTTADLVGHARHPKVVAIGEAGLDTFFGNASWDAQIEVLANHIAAARETQLPLVVHCVRQDEAMAAILDEETRKGAFPVLMHCFSGGRALAETNLSLGHYISFSGLLTFEENAGLREIARDIPSDRILVETDAPSLAPAPHRDERNEPAHIRHTLEALAEARSATVETIARQTTENFYRLFTKVPEHKHGSFTLGR
jgi:TatD DNase family protein